MYERRLVLPPGIALLASLAALMLLVYLAYASVQLMAHDWLARPEYSHGMLVPVLSAYLLYVRRDSLIMGGMRWPGALIVLLGLAIVLAGSFATVHALTQYGFVTCVIGLFYALFGTAALPRSIVPLCLLYFMVPLPHFLHQAASAQLQLWSSQIGVQLIELMGISVYLEGNVIDLGIYKLQVLEACDGLRYLFPLLTLSVIFAYLYPGPLLHRLVLALSAIPITVLMNSARIAMIGWMVDRWGISMAEGFLHDFQGWMMFLICVVILLLEAKVLARLSGRTLAVIDLIPVEPARSGTEAAVGTSRATAIAAPTGGGVLASVLAAVLVVAAVGVHSLVDKRAVDHTALERRDFLDFPLRLEGGWQGQREVLDTLFVDELQFDDYLLANYRNAADAVANVYVAYYADQTQGRSVHSPRTCLPGGGWKVQSFDTVRLPDGHGGRMPVNRVVIGKGSDRQLVYYWFEQRGRVLTNEYRVKWQLLVDAMFNGRSDGALVRLISPVAAGSSPSAHDETLAELTVAMRRQLAAYVPG